MNKLSKLSLRIVRAGLFITPFFTFLTFHSTVFPYLLGRVMFFQILIELLFPLYLYLAFTDKSFRPKKSFILCSFAAYIAVLFVTAIFGVDLARSFWGYRDRMDGLFTILHFFAFFIMLASVFKNKKDWMLFFKLLLASGFVVIAHYYSQVVSGIILAGKFFLPRAANLFGNVMFLAAFSSFMAFTALILFAGTAKRGWKIFYALAAFIFGATVFLSLTRSAMLGLFAALGAVLLWLIIRAGKKVKIFAILGLLAFVSSAAAVFLFKERPFVSGNPVLNRIASISPSDATGATRLMAWTIALKAFKDRPLFGWGYINFYAPFNKYYDAKLLAHSVSETWFDRAHSVLFEHLASTGIAGTLAYLVLIISALYAAAKFRGAPEEALAGRFAGLAIIAYVATNLFSIENFSPYLVFCALLAYLGNSGSESRAVPIKLRIPGKLIIVFAAVLCIFAAYFINWKSFIMSRKEMSAVSASGASSDIKIALSLYREALAVKTPYTTEAKLVFAESVTAAIERKAFGAEEEKDALAAAVGEIDEETILKSKISTRGNFIIGRLFSEWARFDPAYFGRAEEALGRAINSSPKRQQMYFGLAKEKIIKNDYAAAAAALKQMIEVDPAVPASHWYAGVKYNEMGFINEAAEELVFAYGLGFDPRTAGDARLLVEALKVKKQLDKIPDIYTSFLLKSDPDNAELYAELAALYQILGEKDQAREAALKAMELDANFVQEGKIFIKSLEK